MCQVGLVAARVQVSGQGKERLGEAGKVSDVKDSGGVWDPVLLEVVIETNAWSPAGEHTPYDHLHLVQPV